MEGAPLVVYVVDDDFGVREALSRLMRAAGHDVRLCASVDELSAAASAQGRRGCILWDLSVARRGRDHVREAGLGLPIIALTGDERESARGDARDAGAAILFRKPLDGRALLDAIDWLAAEPRPIA